MDWSSDVCSSDLAWRHGGASFRSRIGNDGDARHPPASQARMIELTGEEAMRAFGARLAGCLRTGDVVALRGDLGVGKTTLARGVRVGLCLEAEGPRPAFPFIHRSSPP